MTTEPPQKQKSPLPFALAFLAGVAGIYWFQGEPRKVETPVAEIAPSSAFGKALATGPMAAVIVHEKRKEILPFTFKTADGKDVTLDQWKGRVVLLNLWATWCAPCRKEMPDLAELQKQLGGPDFEVVALSVDKKGAEASAAFLKEVKADNLATYSDTELKSLAQLQAVGLPATILIDRQGKEAARLLGPAPWSSTEAITMIKTLLAEK
jgi:thiol-disulfide isomerase/thioredoxin